MDESMSEHSDGSDSYDDSTTYDSDSTNHTSSVETLLSGGTFQLKMSGKNIWSKINTTYKKFEGFYRKINKYYETGAYTDVNVTCKDEDEIFKCHRLALAAASEYFYDLFREYPDQDVVHLKDIDSDTFHEIILHYVYTGEIDMMHDDCDHIIYSALRASTILGISAIEDHCVHHLTQRNIPVDYAVDLYLYASSSRKVVLLPALSRFILRNLDRFSRESKFLSMSGEDFSALLTHFHQTSSSATQETILLDTILRWVCHSTDIRENRKLYFTKLAEEVEFRFVPAAYVSEYFDRNTADNNGESHPTSEIPGTSNLCLYSMISRKASLHAYIRTTADMTCIFSLNENYLEEGIDWHRSGTMSPPAIKKMRIVESDGRLYYLKYQDERFTFGSSRAINLSTDMQSLALPTELGSIPDKLAIFEGSRCHTRLFSLCSLQRKIYMRSNSVDFFQSYNTEVDSWSAIPEAFTDNVLKDIVSDGTRLYLVDLDEHSRMSLFSAYDPRVGITEKLCTERLVGCVTGWSEPAVYHKGRIYLPEDDPFHEFKDTFKMAVYDPIAGRWDVQNLRTYFFNYTSCRQLVSLGEYLWMFGWVNDKKETNVFTQLYDAYVQDWNTVGLSMLNRAVLEANLRSLELTDVIVF